MFCSILQLQRYMVKGHEGNSWEQWLPRVKETVLKSDESEFMLLDKEKHKNQRRTENIPQQLPTAGSEWQTQIASFLGSISFAWAQIARFIKYQRLLFCYICNEVQPLREVDSKPVPVNSGDSRHGNSLTTNC